jgi:putative oxidoreductase
MTNILDLIGRVFISGVFLLSGFNKIGNYDGTVGWMESFGLPGFLLIPAIVLEIIAPILIIIGYQTRIAAGALSLFCLATAIIFHTDFSDQMQFVAFMKNLALAGGFLFLVVNGARGYCIDKK